MNIRQIEIFKAVMEAGSVTAASERLRIAQPSTSKHLKLLEAQLGMMLFQRTGNRVVPTSEAHALYDQVERTYQGLEHLSRFAESLKHHPTGEISVAAMPLLARRWLPEIIGSYLRDHQGLSIALPIRSSRWIADAVAAGQVDIGLGLSVADAPGVLQEPLMQTPLVCVMPPDHALVQLSRVTPAELSGQTLITMSNFDHWRLAVETELERAAAGPLRRVDTSTTQVACELALRGTGVAIVDLLTALDYVSAGLVWRPFEPSVTFDIALMRPQHRPVSRLAQELTVRIKELASDTKMQMVKTVSMADLSAGSTWSTNALQMPIEA